MFARPAVRHKPESGLLAKYVQAKLLPPLAFCLQAVILHWDDGSHRLGLMVLSFALLLQFTWQNRSHRPMCLLFVGLMLNLAPIVVHHGYMPMLPETMATLF